MRVLLTDPLVGGHHVEYATYLTRCMREQGDEVGFVAWRPHSLLDPLGRAGAIIYYAAPTATKPVGGSFLTRMFQISNSLNYALTVAHHDGFDLVHDLFIDRHELAAAWAMLRYRSEVPVFATLFWPYFIHSGGDGSTKVKSLLHAIPHRTLGQLLAKGMLEGLFVHTEYTQEKLFQSFGNTPAASRIHVVPDPAIMPSHTLTKDEARRLLGLPLSRPLALFFGGLRADKGYDVLLRAIPLLKADVGVVIAGEAGSKAISDVEASRKHMSSSDRLLARLGRVDDEDVERYFSAADIVVIPYRCVYAGTSGVLQHAAAAGRPVVTADVGQIGGIVQRNFLGITCEPESPVALARAIDEAFAMPHSWHDQVQEHAQRYAQSQDWRILGQKVRAIYMHALNS
jgi:glycosyltransferase involved in cell wall biosynthesis